MRTLHFLHRGQPIALANVPPERTLLQVLREDLGHTATKEGCGEGDCGACTVVVGEAQGEHIRYRAINSCIRLAHSIDGMALWTAQDLAQDPLIGPAENTAPAPAVPRPPSRTEAGPGAGSTATGVDRRVHEEADGRESKRPAFLDGATTPPVRAAGLHPAQEALVQCHGSQCGFCTPGFVMGLFAMYQNRLCQGETITRGLAVQDLSGNLCRCTGYRPILDAAQHMAQLPRWQVNEPELLQKLKLLALIQKAPEADLAYMLPTTLEQLLAARAAHPQAQIVAGGTDVGLWVTQRHQQFAQVLDVTRVAPLRQITHALDHLAIGAAATLTDAFAALVQQWPQLHTFATRFAGLPVRNAGTLGGNVANGSPIGDAMPLLIALRAQVVLASVRGERSLALEDFYTGYRQNVLAPDEVLVRITVPRPGNTEPPPDYPQAASAASGGSAAHAVASVGATERSAGPPQASSAPPGGSAAHAVASVGATLLRAYKVSKRFDDDISAVCLVLNLTITDGQVQSASIGAGGVAATPARARATEAALIGHDWSQATVQRAAQVLQGEFTPLSDMRASAAYRSTLLANLLQRFWLESQGTPAASLEGFVLDDAEDAEDAEDAQDAQDAQDGQDAQDAQDPEETP
ncbi:MAG: FAD binding domain-containing protein [Simplicispira sp.]|nr:FAD binding domain-containing protein [Simplicispira sp.]